MDELTKAIKEKAVDKKISCKIALKIAEDLGVNPYAIGQECNSLGIKIKTCQLGCFK